jgi:hypothetical protein
MSYSGNKEYDHIPLAKCYECVVNRIPFISSSRTLRGEVSDGKYIVRSYGVPIALIGINYQWYVTSEKYSVTTSKHINAIVKAIQDSGTLVIRVSKIEL